VPVVAFPPPTPSTVHETAVLVVPLTVAVNCCDCDDPMETDEGMMDTLIADVV